MSRIACVWAELGDDTATSQWYEDSHIPDVVARLDTTARHAGKAEDNMFKEVAAVHGTVMTVYDLKDEDDAKDIDAQIIPALDKLSEDVSIDARCYTELTSWLGGEWRGDVQDIQMWIVVLWQPVDAYHDEFVSWFSKEFAPGMLESPELLRMRIFKLDNASTVKDQKHEQQNTKPMYQYLTFWEFDCDDLPWEILLYLGGSERWRYYVEGGHLKWQISQYLVDRIYPEEESADSPAAKRASVVLNGGSLGDYDSDDSESDDDNEDVEDKTGDHANSKSEPYLSR